MTETTKNQQSEMMSVGSSFQNLSEGGWYGFCLGSRKGRKCCSCSLSLVFDDNRIIHKLPFQVDGKTVFSLDYGQMVFCKPDSVVRVVLSNEKPCDYHKTNPSDLQWRLVLRHASSVNDLSGGELSGRARRILCATCNRAFSKVQAAQAHFDTTHKVLSATWSRPLTVVYNDNEFAVVDKPQGISIQGSEGKTLQQSDLLVPLTRPNGRKPIIVHRLDAPTGGLLVVAKTKHTERHFRMAFAAQRIKKRYRAVTFGRIQEESGVIEEPISGKASETRYRVISRTPCNDSRANGWITTVDLYPISGRRHQIRRHLKHIGHPIWGDRRYGSYTKKQAPEEDLSEDDKLDLLHATTVEDDAHARLCLWAMEICVPHPTTDAPVHIVLPKEPDWISQLLKIQEKMYFDSLPDEELKSASGES